MTVAFGTVLTVKLIRKRFSMNWLQFRAPDHRGPKHPSQGEFRSTMIVAAGESLIRHGIVPRR